MAAVKSVLLVCLLAAVAEGRVFGKCEVAQNLKRNGVPVNQIATWVCIAYYESRFNAQAVNNVNSDGSSDHGIFQINDKYWCSPPGQGCGVTCDQIKSDNLDAAINCVKKIYDETMRRTGDGFSAWAVYSQQGNCRTPLQTASFIEGCGIEWEDCGNLGLSFFHT